jgi:hypothetical protein
MEGIRDDKRIYIVTPLHTWTMYADMFSKPLFGIVDLNVVGRERRTV